MNYRDVSVTHIIINIYYNSKTGRSAHIHSSWRRLAVTLATTPTNCTCISTSEKPSNL